MDVEASPNKKYSLPLDRWLDALGSRPMRPVKPEAILAWVEGPLRRFFPFERFIAGYGEFDAGSIKVRQKIASGYDDVFMAQVEGTFDLQRRGCFSWWMRNRSPFVLDGLNPPDFASQREIDEVLQFGLGIVAGHGVVDPASGGGTYFSFSGIGEKGRATAKEALELIAPVLHSLMLETVERPLRDAGMRVLSKRQRELVKLALAGLNNKAIARQLGISEHTVGNHFRSIYSRLGISKRAQLSSLSR